MSYTMKRAVEDAMTHATEDTQPFSIERYIHVAQVHQPVALLLPFYMYMFRPHEWQTHTLLTASPFSVMLNHATYAAVDAPSLQADPSIIRFFYSTSMLAPLPTDHPTVMPFEEWVYHLFRQYHQLQHNNHV